jgi:hypothetical protein
MVDLFFCASLVLAVTLRYAEYEYVGRFHLLEETQSCARQLYASLEPQGMLSMSYRQKNETNAVGFPSLQVEL